MGHDARTRPMTVQQYRLLQERYRVWIRFDGNDLPRVAHYIAEQ